MEPVTATDKTLMVLRSAITHRRFTDIVEDTGLAKATVHRILQKLLSYGFLTFDEQYFPGPAMLSMASEAFDAIDISAVATPVIHRLAHETGFTVHVGARNDNEAIYVAIDNGRMPYRLPSHVGDRLSLHSTSIGKVLLATSSPEYVADYADHPGLNAKTPRTITNLTALTKELDRVREQGYALDDEENVPGIRCVGAPVTNYLGQVSHAVSVTTLAMENVNMHGLADEVVRAATEISYRLGS
ncbi:MULTISPECIES: IclR family transcriptional regulator [Auritidibacter]|uniref:IclR family transcriptional regulator n=1 Tax=Auritidibacter ignavus TaxID=678932 RepID=A0AAJ6DBT8_9MICC|nr:MULTISPECIES: IclR family transcriptional regulator [Auritidibacter]PXA78869.1 IclR family transcriptional regulator [Auritidibacter sp. NML120779]NIH71065.1 DNA-binding IclR family transcriptional regulator [Auritidibacter ignavus]PXA79229.1 IclR family transcriptional regulator [Auritidibacter sp. NML120636]RMX23011.1 IclR family transcriptional regulator [Auritidibacter ignavus]WGH81212.1 IclR family transcriptional regulator [Auritidibacter ignavus]